MIAFADFTEGSHRSNCPHCSRSPRDKTLGVTVERDGRGVAHCHRCHYVQTHRPDSPAWQRRGVPAARPVQAAKHEVLSDYGHELLRACSPIHGDGRAYLLARHCALPPEDGDLRFHPKLKHPSGYVGAALVGLVTDAVTREPMTLHRTWVRADGRKADVDPPRMLLGGHRKQGGVVRLWSDDYVTHGLAIAEGIETALSLAHAYTPVWAAIDASNLAALPVLPGVGCLLIGRDNDAAGIKAAAECARRWANAGCEVRVTTQTHNDMNDVLLEETA